MMNWVAAPAALLVCLAARTAAAAEGHVVYLNFSDGTESIHPAAMDDAQSNQSRLCEAQPVLPWSPGTACGAPADCRGAVLEELRALWRPFNVSFTTSRPVTGDYAMVVVAPRSGNCRFGVDGLAFVDCNDQVTGNIAFVFECTGSGSGHCARLISHELGHSYGLGHSNVSCDLMSGDALECMSAMFMDQPTRGAPSPCDGQEQNSYRSLMDRLGPNPNPPGGDDAAAIAGCTMAGGRPAGPWPVPAMLLLGLLVVRRRAACRRARTGHRQARP